MYKSTNFSEINKKYLYISDKMSIAKDFFLCYNTSVERRKPPMRH